MSQGVAVVCFLIIFGLLVIKCTGRVDQRRDKSISCYECNSEYDPRCGDPFDPYTIGMVNCSKKRALDHIKEKPTLCRKTVQKVQGHIRVIRGCGYLRDERDDKECVKRSGTHDVQVTYCSCSTKLCNTGHQARPINSIVIGAIVLAITFKLA